MERADPDTPIAAVGRISIEHVAAALRKVQSMDLPRKELIANQYAAGVPTATTISIAAVVVSRLSSSASRLAGSPSESKTLRGSVLVRIATSGVTRKSSVRSIAANVAAPNQRCREGNGITVAVVGIRRVSA